MHLIRKIFQSLNTTGAKKRKRNYKDEYWRSGRDRYLKYKEEKRTWYDLNKDEATKRNKKWQKENPEKRRETALAYYYRNRRTILEKQRKRYWSNPEKYRKEQSEKAKRLYWKDPIKARRKLREQYKRNPEMHRKAAGWYAYKRKNKLQTNEGKRTYLWQRQARKDLAMVIRDLREGAISERQGQLLLRLLELKLQQK